MSFYDKSSIVLMVQNPYTVFCYYNISDVDIRSIEDIYGKNSWETSKPILKVYEICDNTEKEISTIYLDPFADNWYINLNKDDISVKVEIGRILESKDEITLAVSNVVKTPRGKESENTQVLYLDTSLWKTSTKIYNYFL
ncbi:DUF4912 domain-containing protein [Clostridium brassicae]|uniref:DUF4912 domain-containing protein n=1 Tax=Clostridium brassicae TaxID=2999072 RepID=A0ABT4D686_9CLOT|nr:DUF4912 domain-containing protein [Clostridium brassicae]MCY6957810.1 DUF4912 domain-containing protein [Clostridium brassicae]